MEEYLKEKIASLMGEIEKLEKKGYATHKKETITNYEYNSDVGVKTPFGEKEISIPMSVDELKESKRNFELELNSLKIELKQARDELFKLEWNKPENVAKRQRETVIRNREEQEQQLHQERLEHEEGHKELNKLVEYLKIAGLHDLAREISQLRFAFKKTKSNYINREIDLLSKEKSFRTKTLTTKKEYKEIKRSVVKLSKRATKIAKKYKGLYNLYLNAWEIVHDIKKKGISEMGGESLYRALKDYFNQPTGEYFLEDNESYYSSKKSANLGYQYLDFYRDYGSKYNEDVRSHKI